MQREYKGFFSAQSVGSIQTAVWNWPGKTLSPGAPLFFLTNLFFARDDFPSPPLTAKGLRGWYNVSDT